MSLIKRNQEKNNKKLFKKIKKQVQGITLIALVVTVIVLLILAGVAINLTVGNNGLFRRAQNAADTYQEASEIEAIEFAVAGMQIGSTQGNNMTKTELENSLKEQFGDEASVEDNEDGSFLVTIGENQYYVGEDGEIIDSSNMVEISTAEELKAFRDDVNSGNTYEGKYVYLANDITLDINEEWEPIGVFVDSGSNINTKPFKGIFDGKLNKISNLKISENTYQSQGLFGFARNAKITNIGLDNTCNITASAVKQGAIVGFIYDSTILSNCYNMSNIGNISNTHAGGIVGTASLNCIVEKCYNNGDVYGNEQQIGGIVGDVVLSSQVLNCYNTGKIKCEKGGGVVGDLTGGSTIANCYNIGIIETNFVEYAGIISYTRTIENNIQNNYYLENVINGTSNDKIIIDGIAVKTSDELKNIYSTLGDAFEEDLNNINNGYPILFWQKN